MLINRNVTHALVHPQVQTNFDMLLQDMNATYSVDENVQRLVKHDYTKQDDTIDIYYQRYFYIK